MTRTVLVGGSGWLGSAILRHLQADGPVRTLSRSELADERPEHLVDLLQPGPDLVVVNAGGRLRGTSQELTRDNVTLPLRLVEVLAGTGAYLLHLGSPAEFGDPQGTRPIPPTQAAQPVSDYGRSKAVASLAVLAHDVWGVLRPFNVIDRDMIPGNPVAIIRAQVWVAAATGTAIELPAAEAVRDHVSREFVAASVARAARDRLPGAFNLCSGIGLSYRAIAEALLRRLGVTAEIVDLDLPGIKVVVGDPTTWREVTGLAEAMDADGVAALVVDQPIGSER